MGGRLMPKSLARSSRNMHMRLIDGSGWLGQTAISSIFSNDSNVMKLSEFSMRFSVLNNNGINPAQKK